MPDPVAVDSTAEARARKAAPHAEERHGIGIEHRRVPLPLEGRKVRWHIGAAEEIGGTESPG